MTNVATRNGSVVVKDGSVAESCGCCGCVCGTAGPYESQTGIFSSAGRWCCSGVRPTEITVRMTASATATSFYSYQRVSGPWFSGQFFDETRGYYDKRYKRTLSLDVSALNADYVLVSKLLGSTEQPGALCGYAWGQFDYPRIFPGYEPFGVTIGGVGYRISADDQVFPSYTMTFQTGNSGLLAYQAVGTILREYEYRKMKYVGMFQMVADGEWTRDATLDTESSPVPCTYGWSLTGHTVLGEPACDLRGKGVSWGDTITVAPAISDAANAVDIEIVGQSSQPIGGGPMLPSFSLVAAVV